MPAALCRFLLELGMALLAQPRHGGGDRFAPPCGIVDFCPCGAKNGLRQSS